MFFFFFFFFFGGGGGGGEGLRDTLQAINIGIYGCICILRYVSASLNRPRCLIFPSDIADTVKSPESYGIEADEAEVFNGHLQGMLRMYLDPLKEPQYSILDQAAAEIGPTIVPEQFKAALAAQGALCFVLMQLWSALPYASGNIENHYLLHILKDYS